MARVSLLVGLLLLVAVIAAGLEKERTVLENKESKADLYWDEWGVPHIFAESFEALTYAFGYAQARDHGALLCRMIFLSSGKASELGGPLYAPIDRLLHSLRLGTLAEGFYNAQDPDSIVALDSFAKGFNHFAETHPEDFTGPFSAILPIDGVTLFKTNLRVLYTFAFASFGNIKGKFEESYGTDPKEMLNKMKEGIHFSIYDDLDPFRYMEVSEEMRHLIGSNGWAINSNSGKTDGKPKLVQNPHLPFEGFFKWYEAQLVCESCDIDIYGAGMVGIPCLQIAFNDYLGWTHTVNPIQAYTGYTIDLASENSYYFDGEALPITTEQSVFKIKQADGSYVEETVINELTHIGQIVARADGKALVKRLAGLDGVMRPDALKQWWEMGKAKNLEEFNNVLRMLQIPMFYIITTTRDDDIMLNFNGWVPKRAAGGSWDYWKNPVNGSISSNLWDDCHPWDELPTIINPESGFVQNANDAPWTTTLPVFSLNPNNYPEYMAPPVSIKYRPQVSLRLISTANNITYEKLVELKHSTLKEATFHSLDSLLEAVDRFGDDEEVLQAAEILRNWDRHTDIDSAGAELFTTWLRVSPDTYELYEVPWDPEDPINTPHTLANPRNSVRDLKKAARRMRLKGQSLNVTWGEANKIIYGHLENVQLIPANGCHDCFRNSYNILGLSLGGDSWVAVIEWDQDSPRARAQGLLGYGNSSPLSHSSKKHVRDQNKLFSEKKLRDFWRTLEEINDHLEEHVELIV